MSVLILALSVVASASHPVSVDHKGAAVQAVYDARVETRMKTVGMSVGTRMGNEACRWEANVAVERRVGGLVKTVDSDKRITGQRPGSCKMVGKHVATEVAARSDEIHGHVRQVAEADRPALIADIEAAHGLAMN
ncbi:hypothetical protein [Sphingomonas montanisoli]|uniref:hypothetical protein n=1 Tax=Sphingomonas montanisoli TaxID=2606412 RepID=UPI0015E183D0|nr:hypothetical protein [Sphingomonas montanisoli]